MEAKYGDRRNAEVRHTSQVMGQANAWAGQLPRAGTTEQLCVDLVRHAQPRGTDRVAKTLEAPINLARHTAVGIRVA